jgi:uncharacterized protein (TIGR01244 family)
MLFGPYQYSPSLSFAGTVEPDDIDDIKRDGFKVVVNNRTDGESPRQVPSSELKRLAEEAGLRFVDIPFKGGNLTADQVAEFQAVMRDPAKTIAVCASGTRCAIITAAAEVASGLPVPNAMAKVKAAGFDLDAMSGFIESFARQ